jgi:autotransporter-associated beta strand protein
MQFGVRRSFAVKIFMNLARAVIALSEIITSNRRYRSALLAMPLAVSALLPSLAEAQSVWGGAPSTTTTTDYNLGTNWSNGVSTSAGDAAVFDATGNASVVTAGTIAPDSWTFNAASQNYTITGDAVNFGIALINNASAGQAISISNNMTGPTLSQAGASTLTLTGTDAFANTTISAGTIVLLGGGSLGNSLVNVGTTGTTATFDISGTTAGTTIQGLEGNSSGVVMLGNQTLISSAGSAANIFYGAINGSGGLTVSGGQQVLGGANTYTGVTTINNGADLGIEGTGSIATSSKVVVNGALDISVTSSGTSIKSLAGTDPTGLVLLGNFTLTITAANDTFAGGISGGGGTGGLTLTGGTETLTGSNGYTGATTINGGTLVVNSSIASSSGTTVNTGGTLAGIGNVGNTAITGGTLAPGSGTPGSSLTVNGILGFTAASTYAVNINPTTSSFANVTGTATLGGATVNAIYANGSYVAKKYTILTAGVVSGTFGSVVNSNLPANFSTSLSYDAKNAYLNLALNFMPPSDPTAPGFGTGLNANQQNVGNALTNFFNATGGIPLAFGALTPAGLSQASGETATGTQQTTFNAMTQFMGVMTDPFIGGRGNGVTPPSGAASSYASTQNSGAARDAYAMFDKAPVTTFDQRWSTWIAGFGGSQTTDGNTALGSNSTTSSIYGTAVGADYRFSPDTLAGFSLAGGGTNFSVANSGSGHSDLFQAGAFVRHTVGPAYLSAALAYGWQDVTTNRTVTVAGIDQLRARFNANAFSGRVETGYRFVTPVMGVTPYAAGQFTTFDLPSYAEGAVSGASTFALAYGAKSVTDTRSELGIRTDRSWAMQDSILTLRGRVAWAHDYDPDRSIATTFQTLPGASFVANGAAQASDSALTTASAEIKWINGWSAAATFEGEFSDVTRSYSGKGVVRYAW